MDDKTCRLEILKELKSFYDREPHAWVQMESLLQAWGLDANILVRNAKYLEQKGLSYLKWFSGGGFIAQISSEGIDFLETGEPSGLAILSPLTIHQEFHGTVGAVAGRDINVQISFSDVLNKLTEIIDANQNISPEERHSLIDKLKSLAGNGWIQSVGTSVLSDLIKKSMGL